MCESASWHFQPDEGPGRGLLCYFEIFMNLHLKLYPADRPLSAQLTARLPALHTPRGLRILPALTVDMVLETRANCTRNRKHQ